MSFYVTPGEVYPTVSGGQTTPAPNYNVGTDRQCANAIRKIDAWLIKNAVSAHERARTDIMPYYGPLDPKQVTDGDRTELNYRLFGYGL